MKKLVLVALLGASLWGVDFSKYSTQELLKMKGTVAVQDRVAFRTEVQKRMASMTPAQRQQYMKNKMSSGKRQGTGQKAMKNKTVATKGRMQNMASFSDFDLNKDGVITKSELLKVRAKRQSANAAAGKLMKNAANTPSFASMDLNNDGKITVSEFNKFRLSKQGTNMRGMGKGQGAKMGRGQGMGSGSGMGMGKNLNR